MPCHGIVFGEWNMEEGYSGQWFPSVGLCPPLALRAVPGYLVEVYPVVVTQQFAWLVVVGVNQVEQGLGLTVSTLCVGSLLCALYG